MTEDLIRIGVLGAARIAPMALIRPARKSAGVTVAAVRDGAPVLTDAADTVRTMTVIDAIYRAAGLPIRQPS